MTSTVVIMWQNNVSFAKPGHCVFFDTFVITIPFEIETKDTPSSWLVFTPQPLRAIQVLFSPMMSGWVGIWMGYGRKLVRGVSQKS